MSTQLHHAMGHDQGVGPWCMADHAPSLTIEVDHRHRHRGFDQIRGVAILFVLAVHTYDPWFPGGGAGVGIFLALSGYLTASKLLRDDNLSAREATAFLLRRVMRLYPAFLLVMAVIAGIISIWVPERLPLFGDAIPGLALFWRPLHWEPLGIGIGILWSLHVEVQYYLLLPLGMLALGARRGVVAVGVGVIVSSLLLAMLGIHSPSHESIFYYGASMGMGSLLAYAERYRPDVFSNKHWEWGWLGGWAVIGVLLFIPQMNARIWWWELTVAGIATCAIIAALVLRPRRMIIPGLSEVGLLAYSLYLVHGPVIDWMRPILGVSMWGKIALFVPLTFGFSWLLYRYVELPMMRLGSRWGTRVEAIRIVRTH